MLVFFLGQHSLTAEMLLTLYATRQRYKILMQHLEIAQWYGSSHLECLGELIEPEDF